jgi:hypothetical protein
MLVKFRNIWSLAKMQRLEGFKRAFLGEDPKTTICGYISGGLCALIVSAVPGLNMDSTVQQLIAALLLVSLGSLGRFSKDTSASDTKPSAIITPPPEG